MSDAHASEAAVPAVPTTSLERLIQRAEGLLQRLEAVLPAPSSPPDFAAAPAFRYRRHGGRAQWQVVARPPAITLADLKEIEPQKARLVRNTRQFVAGQPANNVLLTGARGTGKSSLIKAVLNAHWRQGLRLIELDKEDLVDLPELVGLLAARPERFILYCDDLSFDEGEAGYKALKSVLDGSVAQQGDNVLVYATSNRRHLLPERMQDNLAATYADDGELHPGEAVEEKISLSERFGLWISFYPFAQEEYLTIVRQWLAHFGVPEAEQARARQPALVWALERGSRSGRVAQQFARDWAARRAMGEGEEGVPAAATDAPPPAGLDHV